MGFAGAGGIRARFEGGIRVVIRFRGIDLVVGNELADAGQKAVFDGGVFVRQGGLAGQGGAVLLRPLAGRAQDQGGDGVEFVGDGTQAQPSGLKGNGAAAGGNIQHDGVGDGQVVVKPAALCGGEVVGEGALVAESDIRPLAAGLDFVHPAPLGHDGVGSAEGADKLGMVGVGAQQSGDHRSAANHQRPPRPPDVEMVDRRMAGQSAPLANGLHGDFVDGEPVFDEARGLGWGGHGWGSGLAAAARGLASNVAAG